MFTDYTFQDWLAETDKSMLIQKIVATYKGGHDFGVALDAQRYFDGDNTEIGKKYILDMDVEEVEDANGRKEKRKVNRKVEGNRIRSDAFFRFVTQESAFLLGNGVTLEDTTTKEKLGMGFDTVLAQMGEKALIHGVCWGYWNNDHLEAIDAAKDALSGAVALLDEITGTPMVLVQFWQIAVNKPQFVRVFEPDGVTVYRGNESGADLTIIQPKRTYKLTTARDGFGEMVISGENYGVLPVFPLYGNGEHRSELTPAIRSKIDLYDRIVSDYGDNLDRANDIYWILNNFGGNKTDVLMMLKQIRELKAVANFSDGTSGATAEPRTIEVPYAARQIALEILEKQMYKDYMALDLAELTGGSLTNVAIKAAMSNLNLKADRFEWQCFAFVQNILKLVGVETEEIRFLRRELTNESETIADIYTMRADIDLETALKLNPYISQDEIEGIIANLDAEQKSGFTDEDMLKSALEGMNEGNGTAAE